MALWTSSLAPGGSAEDITLGGQVVDLKPLALKLGLDKQLPEGADVVPQVW